MEFSSKNNTQFSKLTKSEKDILISEISEILIPYRSYLNFKKDVSFGVEVEYDKADSDDINLFRESQLPSYYPTHEKSLPKGGELTSKVLHDKTSTWRELRKLCEFLRIHGAVETEEVGSHIHVSVANTLGDNPTYWMNFVKMLMAYEKIMYRFTNGESITPRSTYIQFCYPIALDLYDAFINCDKTPTKMHEIKELIPMEKFQSINFKNVKWNDLLNNNIQNTIELRTPNGTFEEIIWQNNINFIVNFLLSCCKEIDEEYMQYRINELSYKYNHSFYSGLDIEGALELADLIFNNEKDKVYFLRQYFKDFEETSEEGLKYTKSFIRRD